MLSLLTTKIRIPITASNLVTRSRLLFKLDGFFQTGCLVAVISAPAGFGKTTLLTQWLQTIPDDFRVGWVSLDPSDNYLIRFFTYVIASLQNCDPAIGDDFTALVETHPDLTAEEIVTYLINAVGSSSQNILLVIDDTHVITSPEIHHALELLVNHLPANLRLVVAGRIDPPLPLARLRARGQLVEIRTVDLRFNIEETGGFLEKSTGLSSLAALLVDGLTRSTEGWAAGLQMTVIAVQTELQTRGGQPVDVLDRLVNELSGSHRFILDYLLDEVLNREEPRVREFLLRTCILERFNADLCAVLCMAETNTNTAQAMLEHLDRANLFIIPLDNQREWFRYHHLFADMLKKQLYHIHPGLESELHRHAANWFEQQDMLDEAMKHALLARDVTYVQTLVEKHTLDFILRGQITTAVRWLDGLPTEALVSSPRLCLDRAWSLTFTSQTEAAGAYLERAEMLMQDRPEEEQPIKSEIFGLLSYQKSIYGQPGEAVRMAQLALAISPVENAFLQCSNRMFLAIALIRNGNLKEALDAYHLIQFGSREERGLAGLALLDADFLQLAAVSLNLRDETKQAIQLLENAIHTFESASTGNRRAATLSLYTGLGKIFYTANRLDEAESALRKGLRIDSLSYSLAVIDGWITLWWVKISQGDYPAARSILVQLESAIQHCDEKITRLVILPGILQDLLEEKVDSAVKRLDQLGFTDDVESVLANISDMELMGWQVNEYFVYARVLAAQGKYQPGLRVLTRMEQAAENLGMNWVLYRIWLTQAIIYSADHQDDTAMEIMRKLLEKTSQSVFGAVQIYLSTGEQARSLLLEARNRGIQLEHVSSLLEAFPVIIAPGPIPDSPESLTEREIEVLQLMAQGLKNQEIADRLVVSLNTVRYHSKNIFGKLGVDNRTAAVARGRALKQIQ